MYDDCLCRVDFGLCFVLLIIVCLGVGFGVVWYCVCVWCVYACLLVLYTGWWISLCQFIRACVCSILYSARCCVVLFNMLVCHIFLLFPLVLRECPESDIDFHSDYLFLPANFLFSQLVPGLLFLSRVCL